MVLGAADDEVAAAVGVEAGAPLHRQVVGLGGAAREDDLARRGADEPRHLRPRLRPPPPRPASRRRGSSRRRCRSARGSRGAWPRARADPPGWWRGSPCRWGASRVRPVTGGLGNSGPDPRCAASPAQPSSLACCSPRPPSPWRWGCPPSPPSAPAGRPPTWGWAVTWRRGLAPRLRGRLRRRGAHQPHTVRVPAHPHHRVHLRGAQRGHARPGRRHSPPSTCSASPSPTRRWGPRRPSPAMPSAPPCRTPGWCCRWWPSSLAMAAAMFGLFDLPPAAGAAGEALARGRDGPGRRARHGAGGGAGGRALHRAGAGGGARLRGHPGVAPAGRLG